MSKHENLSEEFKINIASEKDVTFLEFFFIMYMDNVLREWKSIITNGISLDPPNMFSFIFRRQIIIQKSEDNLQMTIRQLNIICEKYNLKFSLQKLSLL